ncbi:MAG: U32 family peptidase [bacterium]
MLHLGLATSWDNKLISVFKSFELSSVKELWGTLNYNPIGSGRGPSPTLIDIKSAEDHIRHARGAGLDFCYLMNAPCTGNQEYSDEGKRAVLSHIEWMTGAGVNYITVSNPFLMALISKHFPGVKLKASVILECNTILKIRKYLNMGCDIINLSFDKNRDFKFLRSIPEGLRGHIELLASDACLFNCPYRTYHYNQMGHASQRFENEMGGGSEPLPWHQLYYPMLCCTSQKCEFPEEWIKSRWIRPEDIKTYQEFGYNRFKIGSRNYDDDTLTLSRVAKSYHQGFHRGNLIDLLSAGSFEIPGMESQIQITIDNRALDGFLDFFINTEIDCSTACGTTCDYCRKIAEKAVTIETQEALRETIIKLREFKHQICEAAGRSSNRTKQ